MRPLKTFPGKLILFLLCTVSAVSCALTAASILICVENNVYGGTTYSAFSNNVFQFIKYNINPIFNTPRIDRLVRIIYTMRYWNIMLLIASAALAIFTLLLLLMVSGRRKDSDEIVPGWFNKIPYDLLVVLCFVIAGICFALSMEYRDHIRYQPTYSQLTAYIAAILLTALLCFMMFVGLCMSAAARIKQHTILKNTVLFRFCSLCLKALKLIYAAVIKVIRQFFSVINRALAALLKSIHPLWTNRSLYTKTVLILLGITFLELIMVAAIRYRGVIMLLLLLEKLIVIPAAVFIVFQLRKIETAGKRLADGELDYQLDTKGMFYDFKAFAGTLNSIGGAMTTAINRQMKSELMKTELITNVSHDLKTPLTSIINYAGLINSEPCENEKIREYSEVLVRQSDKLKRLIEDLVEVSKATTGNLEVNLAPCNLSVLVSQTIGEYEEKLGKSSLSLVTSLPETPVTILADGRRMWRAFDNLMNNVCKYSLPGSRVYLSLEVKDALATVTIKNTSKEALNISAEELMERFVRGDASRNTEGNGLGLSIARSMAELQKGTLDINIDGDLFKAILAFPLTEQTP